MAHYRRKRSRCNSGRGSYDKWRAKKIVKKFGEYQSWHWLCSWPIYWDLLRHIRPKRREEKALLGRVMRGEVDPDDVAWPLGNHKPHEYYW